MDPNPFSFPGRPRPVNGLKDPTKDPAFLLPDREHDSFDPSFAQASSQYGGGNDFHRTMAETDASASYSWLSSSTEQPGDHDFNDFLNYDHDLAAESNFTNMNPPPLLSSESSQSGGSSVSSKRQKSNDGSGRSSFSIETGTEATAMHRGHPHGRLGGTAGAASNTSRNAGNALQPLAKADIEAMDRLAMVSNDNSPIGSFDSNAAATQAIAGMSMPYDTPDMTVAPLATTDLFPDPLNDSSDSSPASIFPKFSPQAMPKNIMAAHADTSLPFRPYQYGALQCSGPYTPYGTQLEVWASRLQTRVETAMEFRVILRKKPKSLQRIRVHESHLTKAKHLKDKDVPLPPTAAELRATVFCDTATRTPEAIQQAMHLAATNPSPPSSPKTKEENKEEDSPHSKDDCAALRGAPVKICNGCVSRETKRLKRSKQKVEETDEWLETVRHHTSVITNGPWIELKGPDASNAAQQLLSQPAQPQNMEMDENVEDGRRKRQRLPLPPIAPGTVAADFPMRICCYCRHQSEATGFKVVFTLRDHHGNVFAQQIAGPLMITDDHKDKEKRGSAPPTPSNNVDTPGHFSFQSGPATATQFSSSLPQSYSTPNLASMGQGYGYMSLQNTGITQPLQPYNPVAHQPNLSLFTPGTQTPNRSRQASPTGVNGPQQKKRKASGSGRLLDGLHMTPINNPHPPNLGPHPATTHRAHASSSRVNRRSHPNGIGGYRTNPPSPPTNGFRGFSEANRSQSMDNFAAAMSSPPTSSYPSQQPSPSGLRGFDIGFQPDLAQLDNSLRNVQASNPYTQQRPASQASSQPFVPPQQMPAHDMPTSRPPSSPKTTIEMMAPVEGPVSGGTQCMFIGSNLHAELQVLFGNRLASSVRVKGGVVLSCIVPPGENIGVVPVLFVRNNPQNLASPPIEQQTHFYKYTSEKAPESRQGKGVQIQDGFPSPDQPSNYGGMSQWPSAGQFQQQYGFGQQSYMPKGGPGYNLSGTNGYSHEVDQGFSETPPSYQHVLAEDDKRFRDIIIRSRLHAVGNALRDCKDRDAFDTASTTAVNTSKSSTATKQRITIGRETISEEQKEKIRAERRENVKTLGSDSRLFLVWVPILILVVLYLAYNNISSARSIMDMIFSYIKDVVLRAFTPAIKECVAHLQDRAGGAARVIEVG